MRKLILVVHTSLDGFVADVNGELSGFEAGEENLEFVCKITEKADAALFGRVSYSLLNSFWPTAADHPEATSAQVKYAKWYNSAEKIVLSTTLSATADATVLDGNIVDRIKELKSRKGKDILLFGSPQTAQFLAQHDLVDSSWIFINPFIYGKGIPLYSGREALTRYRLDKTHVFKNGEIALHYIKNNGRDQKSKTGRQ